MFRSFYLAGFECATGYNMHGEWIDQVAATEHDLHVDADYSRLAEIGIYAVREAIRWPLVDRAGTYDFSTVQPFVNAALRYDFDVIWDLFHYGYPDDADPFSSAFSERFADYCHAAACFVRQRMERVCYFTPVNEPSYLAWAAGEVGRFAPHARGRGFELKVALARAALRGIAAIRDACPTARIVNVDPVCRVVPNGSDPAAVEHARKFNDEWVFEFWDMVSGRIMPELGGTPENLDIVGLNYYWTNQWELGREGVPLADDDPRRVPLADLVRAAWERYRTDVVITETSALGEARAPWIRELSLMAEQLLDEGVPLDGICLYPILSMPEWHAPGQWARMGLWDLEHDQDVLRRKTHAPMLQALRAAQRRQPRQLTAPEGVFTLPRTGNAPLVLHGKLLWESPERHAACRIRLIRSDQPYRLWIAAIELCAGMTVVEHVSTAAELPLLCDQLRRLNPTRIAEEHGVAEGIFDEASHMSWDRDLQAIVDQARVFETIPMSQIRLMADTPVPGGGRS
ncbi:MAG: hypothetical protein V7640_4095 [Betaproteobacteria bacterium]